MDYTDKDRTGIKPVEDPLVKCGLFSKAKNKLGEDIHVPIESIDYSKLPDGLLKALERDKRLEEATAKACEDPLYKPKEMVDHPDHYNFGKYEVIEVLDDWFFDDALLWQVVKYLARAKHKENFLQDLKKAKWYLERRIHMEEAK